MISSLQHFQQKPQLHAIFVNCDIGPKKERKNNKITEF
jgi:hypothetical protein